MNSQNLIIRPMTPADCHLAATIDKQLYKPPKVYWDTDDFKARICAESHRLLLADYQQQLIAYIAYEFNDSCFDLLRFCVAREFQRQGVGSILMNWLFAEQEHRKIITMVARESDKDMLAFLVEMGFRCRSRHTTFFADTKETGYLMVNDMLTLFRRNKGWKPHHERKG